MGRSFSNNRLLDKLIKGEYVHILEYVKKDDFLRIEMRVNNQAKIYYKKSLIMTLFPSREPMLLSSGYYQNKPKPVLILDNPESYFISAKQLVEEHKRDIKKNIEFEIQQRIAKVNSTTNNRFLVLDMEYQFAQDKVQNRTKEKTRFDIVAIDLKFNKIILFELKQGLNSLSGTSGADDHFVRYQEHIKHPQFITALREDVKGILWSKKQLGLFDFDINQIMQKIEQAKIDYAVIFAAHTIEELNRYKQQFGSKYKTIYINIQSNNFILNDGI